MTKIRAAANPPEPLRAAILRWRATHPGLSCRQIGARFGVSGLTVHRVLLAEPEDGFPFPGGEPSNTARAFLEILRDRSRAVREAFNIARLADAVPNRTDGLAS